MRSVIIFGAGTGGKLAKWMLEDFGYRVIGFSDNNESIWGSRLEEVPVIPPSEFAKWDADIVIASVWEEEIRHQLNELGLGERIVGKEECMYEYMQQNLGKYAYIQQVCVDHGKAPTFLFGTDLGLYQGGVESWTYTVADELKRQGYQVKILTSDTSAPAPERFEEDTCYLNMRRKGYCSGLKDTVDVILENSPCIVIDSWQSMTMHAAAIVKSHREDAVLRLIEIVHNDLPRLFRCVKRFEAQIDYCMGVSRDINRALTEEYGINCKKVRYKENPICFESVDRMYSLDPEQCIRIGYAARLVRSQKRADLLIPLVEKLVQRGIHFRLQIAGSGALSDSIETYIAEHQLEDRVKLMGFLPREQMKFFWSDQDIFINVSEYEGAAISMLEAMGYGCVPVVFEVSGCKEYIGVENGYVCKNGDLDEMADDIGILAADRDQIRLMGDRAKASIRQKCDIEAYVNHLLNLL